MVQKDPQVLGPLGPQRSLELRSRKEETFKAMVLLIVKLARGRNGTGELVEVWEPNVCWKGRPGRHVIAVEFFKETRTCHTYLPLMNPGTHIEVCFKINRSVWSFFFL